MADSEKSDDLNLVDEAKKTKPEASSDDKPEEKRKEGEPPKPDNPGPEAGPDLTGKDVGWFEKNGQLITIKAERGQTAEEAIKEEAVDHGVDPGSVNRGTPPSGWKPSIQGSSDPKPPKPPGNPEPVESTAQDNKWANGALSVMKNMGVEK